MNFEIVGGKFGYRIQNRSDGRVEFIDPEPRWKRGTFGFDRSWTPTSDLLGWVLFLPLLCVPIVFIVVGVISLAAGNVIWGIISVLGGATAAVAMVNTMFMRRCWRVGPGSIARYFEIKGLPIHREKHYPGIDRLEILHAVWHDNKGCSDSIVGWASSRRFSLMSLHQELKRMRASRFAEVGLERVISPQIWWLGHELATSSGLPLEIKTGKRDAPMLPAD